MRLDLSIPIEIRPVRDGDLDGLDWDSEQAIQADYVRKTVAEQGDDVVFVDIRDPREIARLAFRARGRD